MSQKDKSEKYLENHNDVFADIYNTLLFKSDVLLEEQLIDASTESLYKAEQDSLHSGFRDISKHCLDRTFQLTTYGIENQSKVERNMPIRIMGYDHATYAGQLQNKKPPSPVVTIVLNFSNKRWKAPKSLHRLLNVPAELKNYVQDYRIKVFDIAFLEDKVIESFTSDFKVVARFIKHRRLHPNQLFEKEDLTTIKHVEAVIHLLATFTGDNTYTDIYNNTLKQKIEKDEAITMCTILDAYHKDGEIKGEIKGKEETFFTLVADGTITLQRAASGLNLTIDELINRMTNCGFEIPTTP